MANCPGMTAIVSLWLLLWSAAGVLANESPLIADSELSLGEVGHKTSLITTFDQDDENEETYGPLVSRSDNEQTWDANQTTPWSNMGSQLYSRADTRPGFPGSDTYGKLLNTPGCFICPSPPQDLLSLRRRGLLRALDTNKMISFMLNTPAGLENKCVFYSRAVKQPPEYLSDETSVWACSKDKITIWHLWPNKAMADSNPQYQDFYGVDLPDNWLHTFYKLRPIAADRGVPSQIQYFENMSEAMAKSCTGEVVVVTQTPESMEDYVRDGKNIWATKERPALLASWRARKISRFLVVKYEEWDNIWELDLETNTLGRRVDPRDLLSRRSSGSDEDHLWSRAACSSGLPQRLSDGDQFSDDYSKFSNGLVNPN
ncbi:hypothetical protein V8F20_005679 [Naviculisporaceae sp. PSN 640]